VDDPVDLPMVEGAILSGRGLGDHPLVVMIGLIASAIAILVFISGKHSLPEFQHSSGDELPQGIAHSSADTLYIRAFNCDDGGRAFINGALVTEVGFGDDSGWVNVTDKLKAGNNRINFQVINDGGAITYGFKVRKDEVVLFDATCGEHHKYGCEGNRQDFPRGVAREFFFDVTVK
jgi:hypothetical protein